MIEYRRGNIFTSGAAALVSPVNCIGVMGKGLALEFKKRFPMMFEEYRQRCAGVYGFGAGKIMPIIIHGTSTIVINFSTKKHWKDNSRLEWVDAGLKELHNYLAARVMRKENYKFSVAIPPLGCGLGGLKWEEVKLLIEKHLGNLEGVTVMVYEP